MELKLKIVVNFIVCISRNHQYLILVLLLTNYVHLKLCLKLEIKPHIDYAAKSHRVRKVNRCVSIRCVTKEFSIALYAK